MKLSSLPSNLGRTVVLGVGNERKGDDAAGIRVVDELKKRADPSELLLIKGGSIPENFTAQIKDFEPNYIIIIDSTDFDGEPGQFSLIEPEKISNKKISSHNLPLSMIVDYLRRETDAEIIFIGIQPDQIKISDQISEAVERGVQEVSKLILKRF